MATVKAPEKEGVPLIVCGDFNGGGECAAIRFMEDGEVLASFVEDGDSVTSSRKQLPLPRHLVDASAVATRPELRPPPATLVVSELISLLIKSRDSSTAATAEVAYSQPDFTDDVIDRLKRIYGRFATTCSSEFLNDSVGDCLSKEQNVKVMGVADVERWLLTINKQLGRGSEFREAARQMGCKFDSIGTVKDDSDGQESGERQTGACESDQADIDDIDVKGGDLIQLPRDGYLSFDGFRTVYEKELRQGKFWGIAYDLAVLGEPLPDAGIYEARYDRIYFYPGPWMPDGTNEASPTRLPPTTAPTMPLESRAGLSPQPSNQTPGKSSQERKSKSFEGTNPLWLVAPVAVMDFTSTEPCPNEREPSDHLPVAAQFAMVIKS
jgi:hypothetical protein